MYVVMLGERMMMMVMVESVMAMVMTRRDEGRRMMRKGNVLGIAIAIV
jgi:hypothetical protein